MSTEKNAQLLQEAILAKDDSDKIQSLTAALRANVKAVDVSITSL